MKKYIWIIVVLLVTLFCLFVNQNNDILSNKSDNKPVVEKNILEQTEYYCIYKGALTEVTYQIYNYDGKVVLEETTDRPLKISMVGNNVVDISIGYGSGVIEHRYYNIVADCFSKSFYDVMASCEKLVAYLDSEKRDGVRHRKIIVENIFDSTLFYKEYELDFSEIIMPVEEASFNNNDTELKVKYFSDEEQIEKEIVLKMQP